MCEEIRVNRRQFVAIAAAAAVTRSARAEDAAEESRARWLAGLPGGLPTNAEWRAYAAGEDERWDRTRTARLGPMQEFAAKELTPLLPADHTLLYPFAGPDALHALALFGGARRHVLLGLEPVGTLPDPRAVPERYFARLGAAMGDLHRLSFFRTQEMASDFQRDGVLGAIVATLARMNGKVSAIAVTPTSARIDWTSGGTARRLDYVQADLSNVALSNRPELAAMLASLAPHATLVKAAMYLLAEARFSTLRKLLVDGSTLLLQDDTGVPLRQLSGFSTRLFGKYEPPGAPYEERFQSDLRAAYDRRSPPALAFGIGYHVEAKRSNLLLASKTR